jgi:formate--tetrahydrofolate ligase
VKGGATGGGRSCVEPRESINLEFTGDFHAVTAANNLLSSLIDHHLYSGNPLGIDPSQIIHRRCLDINDRALRRVLLRYGEGPRVVTREEHFVITAASEIMAILGLSTSLADLKRRLSSMLVGYRLDESPVFAGELKAPGAMAAILRDALKPNLVQTTEGGPALVHGGPFANVAHGTNTVVADQLALGLADLVITETGFGSDLGAEKFVHIVAPSAGLKVDAAVLVVNIPSLKMHGGRSKEELGIPDPKAVEAGLPNLDHHVAILKSLGMVPVVALNRFPTDTDREAELVLDHLRGNRVACAEHHFYAEGGAGGQELAREVERVALSGTSRMTSLYRTEDAIEGKIEVLASKVYGADGVDYGPEAREDIRRIAAVEAFARLPLCVAKTQASLSDDPALKGVPRGWRFRVRRIFPRSGAGFLVVQAGNVELMPGLGKKPAAWDVDISDEGQITGLR